MTFVTLECQPPRAHPGVRMTPGLEHVNHTCMINNIMWNDFVKLVIVNLFYYHNEFRDIGFGSAAIWVLDYGFVNNMIN